MFGHGSVIDGLLALPVVQLSSSRFRSLYRGGPLVVSMTGVTMSSEYSQ